MHTRKPDPPPNPPAEPLKFREKDRARLGASTIKYVGRNEPSVPVPMALAGLAALAAAIIAFLHFFGT
jgi:hypothetical protein